VLFSPPLGQAPPIADDESDGEQRYDYGEHSSRELGLATSSQVLTEDLVQRDIP
jgi:hypothetical protein